MMRKSSKFLIVYVFLLLLIITAMALLWVHSNKRKNINKNRDYTEIQKEGVLRLITEYTSGMYYITGDTIRGFQYELSRAIADISGLEVQIKFETSLTESFKALDEHTCDAIARNIPVDIEIKENYTFTDPIVMNKQVLLQRNAAANGGVEPIRNQLELAGKTIYVPKDSPALLRLKHLSNEIGDSIHVIENPDYSSEQLAIMVAKHDIDYAVCDQQLAVSYMEHFPELDSKTDISFTQLQAWALRKEAVILKDSLNSWFRQIRENGTYDKIFQRYYNSR